MSAGDTSQGSHEAHGAGHVVPMKVLLGVWIALMILTVLTVAVTYVDLGEFNIWVALIIACVKATLVALYFMHLRYDRAFNGVVLLGTMIFVLLFLGITMMDTNEYQPEMIPGYAPEIEVNS